MTVRPAASNGPQGISEWGLLVRGSLLLVSFIAVLSAFGTTLVHADPALCRPGQNDRSEQPTPDALLPQLGRTFGVAPEVLQGTSYVRCAGGRLMGCVVGANLNCGQANLSRTSEGGDAFCRDNPGSDVIPMAASGHDTNYNWHCSGKRAVPGKVVESVDGLGFMSRNWRPLR